MAITNLTNTRWQLNDVISPFGEEPGLGYEWYGVYNIHFTANNSNYLVFMTFTGGTGICDLSYRTEESGETGAIADVYNFMENVWYDESYRIITITGGDDVTNPDFIAWLEANATQVEVEDPGYNGDDDGYNENGYYITFSSPNEFTLQAMESRSWSDVAAAKNWDGIIEYSTDTTTWAEWDGVTKIASIDGKLYLRGSNNTVITGPFESISTGYHRFKLTGNDISCIGNIETLLDYKVVANNKHPEMAPGCFAALFVTCMSLITAPELPATTLADYCYSYMFEGCINLTAAPKLPATTLAPYCYYYMFEGCVNLTTAPELPATTLADSCYSFMFKSTNLTTAPKLPATTLADYCYNHMFVSTNLTVAPELPATTLADYCYSYMFDNCANLTITPELPATTLAPYCYYYMFVGCVNLTTAPKLPATTLADSCYYYMFDRCINLTIAPELPATTLADSCYRGMFNRCINLTTAPKLPATTLADSCYYHMFKECISLTTAPKLPATTLADSCYRGMFCHCTNLVATPKLPATTLADSCYSNMFKECISLTDVPRLPATILADNCYYCMFYSCLNINTLPEIPASSLANNCYSYMFSYCEQIKISTMQSDEYPYEYRIPSRGNMVFSDDIGNPTDSSFATIDMFAKTGGIFTGSPEFNTVYYTSNKIVKAYPQETPGTSSKSSAIFDLSTLSLSASTHTVYVTLSAERHRDSGPSNIVEYIAVSELPPFEPATIVLDGDLLKVYDVSGLATSTTIYANGEAKCVVDFETLTAEPLNSNEEVNE